VSTVPTPSAAGTHLTVYRCPRTGFMKLTFRQLQDQASVLLTPKIEGIKPDFYPGDIWVDTTLNAVNLPLNPNADSVRFDVKFRDYGDHFVTLKYRSKAWAYDNEHCGSYALKTYAGLTPAGLKGAGFDFDSVKVVKDSLQDPPVTNITAYRCPDIGFMRVSFRTPSAPVRADSLKVVKLTDNKGKVLYENVELASFTLPLIAGVDENTGLPVTETEFTFDVDSSNVRKLKKLKIGYTQDSKPIFPACGIQTVFNTLSILSTDFASKPGTPTAAPKVDHTTFPISTNFEIIK
jgi:hypothetical protein